ncbi:MAG: gluconate 2-dehydrogenase subunit 3 family protein [Bacteroidota bacterium]
MDRRSALKNAAFGVTGSALTPVFFSLLQSCQEVDRLAWQPVFLTEPRARFLSAFVDTLLPTTQTPGGLDVKVDIFIDRIFGEIQDEDGQNGANSGLDKLNELAMSTKGQTLSELSKAARTEVFRTFESEDKGRFQPGVWGTSVGEGQPPGFYRSLKSMALWGYFSSQEIGKEVLNYDPIPGVYQGCISLEEVGRLWSF